MTSETSDGTRARAEAIARRHGTTVVAELGAGEEHVAFALAVDVVLRVRRDLGPEVTEAVEREAGLLALVARVSPLPTPEVVFAEPAGGALAVRRLPGTSLLDRPCPDPRVLVEPLARFLAALHAVPVEEVEGLVPIDDTPLEEWLAEARAHHAQVRKLLPAESQGAVERFLATPPPPPSPLAVLCHADLGAEHLLAEPDPWRLTGVLDLSDAAVTDPAVDLARLHRDLGPDVAAAVTARLGHLDPGAPERAAFLARCTLLEDLAYGLDVGDRRYVDAALGSLTRTMGAAGDRNG